MKKFIIWVFGLLGILAMSVFLPSCGTINAKIPYGNIMKYPGNQVVVLHDIDTKDVDDTFIMIIRSDAPIMDQVEQILRNK